jgi:hypothetical protein
LVIDKSGAKSAADCELCPAGKICSENNTLAVACTVGFYCPYNATMRPCLIGTYSNTVGATNSSSCRPCPAGYWCNRSGIFSCFMFYILSILSSLLCCCLQFSTIYAA